ncbi:hypothetical protein 65p314 [Aeromonas phage 65]|uniref:Uncharacterized protein n=2 Tax=Ishigurovirus osborne TaxID=260149 RepID=A0A219YCF9_9CAUD|nr:hypothetical protein ST65p314 [Aeromonas phage 65]ADQ53322.1 hypothetical protein 65p314 [Aeromonas phage 65]APU01686.1 hypothetical protein [Aeromonas phage 65.2]
MNKFDMSFQDAMDYVLNNKGWCVGEHYRKGVVMSQGSLGTLMTKDFIENSENPMIVSVRSFQQKYRAVHTQPEVM